MKILVDLNLSPAWVPILQQAGYDAVHWSAVGDYRAPDTEILEFARTHGYLVFTHDLDFTVLVALARQSGPSVLQVRTHRVLPGAIGGLVLSVLRDHAIEIEQGALISVDEASARVRILPIP